MEKNIREKIEKENSENTIVLLPVLISMIKEKAEAHGMTPYEEATGALFFALQECDGAEIEDAEMEALDKEVEYEQERYNEA